MAKCCVENGLAFEERVCSRTLLFRERCVLGPLKPEPWPNPQAASISSKLPYVWYRGLLSSKLPWAMVPRTAQSKILLQKPRAEKLKES